jgi:hypothetical protein
MNSGSSVLIPPAAARPIQPVATAARSHRGHAVECFANHPIEKIHHLAMVATASVGEDCFCGPPPLRSHRCQAVEGYANHPIEKIHHLAMVATASGRTVISSSSSFRSKPLPHLSCP